MSLTSIIKSWFKEKPKPVAQKCTGYLPNERIGLLDNFNRYVQQNHGYKRMHLQEYMEFYNRAREDVRKAAIKKPYYESRLEPSYSWEYVR